MADAMYVVMAAASSLSLTCLCLYIGLAATERSELLYSTSSTRAVRSWYEIAFFLFAAIGFVVCLYQGADAMLSWMPDEWGRRDDDGEYQTVRSYISGLFAMVAGVLFVQLIDGATHDKFHLRELQLRNAESEDLNKSLEYSTAEHLRKRADDYDEKADERAERLSDRRKRVVYREMASLARRYAQALDRYAMHSESQLIQIRKELEQERQWRRLEEQRHQQRRLAEEWETDYLRKNPGARITVRGSEESPSGSYTAVRELVSPSGEVVRSWTIQRLAD